MKMSLAATALVAACLLGASVADAAAKCSTRDFAGRWQLKSSTGFTCAIQGSRSGSLGRATCYVTRTGRRAGSLSGKIKISSSCAVTGQVQQHFSGDRDSLTIRAKMSADKRQISGVGVGARNKGFRFTAVKKK